MTRLSGLLPLAWLVLAAWAPAPAAAEAARGAQNPLASVLQLLDELTAKIVQEGEDEIKAFKEFAEWCEDAARNKQYEIKTAATRKEELQAGIGKATGNAEAAAAKIEELAGSIASDESDLKSATEIRSKEFADFSASESELMEAIDTLGRAIAIIERQMKSNPAALAQVDASSISSIVQTLGTIVDAASFSAADQQRLYALVQAQQSADAEDEEPGAPAAAAYKSHSSSIVDTLEDLREKAEEQLSSLRKAETNAKHNFEMLRQSLEDQVGADTKDMQDEKVGKAGFEEAKATAENELAKAIKILEDGNVALETVKGSCMTTAADHEATIIARDGELKVIAQAKQLLEGSTSGAVGQSYSFLQLSHSMSVRSKLQTRADLAKVEVITLVKKLAQEHHSAALAQLASRIAAALHFGAATGEDPFAKVKSLITDMISRLVAEGSGDATEKAYCDEQMAKTEEKKGELEFDVSKLTSKIDQAAAKSVSLKNDVQRVEEELAALVRSQAVMDKTRYDEHAAYIEAKADLEAGLMGVRKALGLLREYYATGAAAAAMLQDGMSLKAAMQQPAAPQKHGQAVGAGSSIIGILEVVESDFAKNLAEVETEEADGEAAYEKVTQENSVTRAMKDQDVKYATAAFKQLDKGIAELSTDRDTTDTELSAVLEYYGKIKERCIAKPETYGERAARREAEIAGLKDALAILEDETAFTQRKQKGLRGHFLGLPQ